MTSPRLRELIPALGPFQDPQNTFGRFLEEKWTAVCEGLGIAGPQTAPVLEELREVLRPWGERAVGTGCEPASFVSADGFPAELSVSWKAGRPEVRILFESLGAERTPLGCQEAGRELTRRLAGRPGASIGRYLDVEDLFVTPDPAPGRPTVWHSLAWQPGERPHYKVYLNPQAHGAQHTHEVMEQAMHRLGLAQAWEPVGRRTAELARRGHELEFFALDLDGASASRVKVYFRHHPMEMAELDAVAALSHRHDPARAARARAVLYGRERGAVANEPMTCLAFRQGAAGPEEANLYLRLPGNAANDAEARARIAQLMRLEGIDPRPHAEVVQRLTAGLAPGESAVQELCSYRTLAPGRAADIGLYLRFNAYAAQPA
ncbi:tryptophan dimethylallyltransferase family protein [Kitasatospora sp. NPDC052868]|uniref:tryptophan dimethylallyltransferase family protein n=1 Tax=Kitasatospora sp. NPDC052868 TaxID=3364060 RepID=UPI0037C88580